MQAVEAERALQKSKRKDYSDAAVHTLVMFAVHAIQTLSVQWVQFRAQKEEKIAEHQEKLRKQEEQKQVLDTVLASVLIFAFVCVLTILLFSTKHKVQQRRAEAENALDQKLFEETQQATINDDLERRQRKVRQLISWKKLDSLLQLELRDENQRYRNYLEQRKLDEQVQQAALDRVLQTELDRQNAIRAQKVHAEKDKRAKLLQEVVEGREQQVLDRSTGGSSCSRV